MKARTYVAAALVSTVVATGALGAPAAAAAEPAPPPPVRAETLIAESTNPAVQAVVSEYRGVVSQRDWRLTPEFFNLVGLAVVKARTGEIGANVEAVMDYVFTRVRRSPGTYFTPTSTVRKKSYVLRGVGSAFVLTPDGVLATAAHVVKPDAGLKQQFTQLGAGDFTKTDIQLMARELAQFDLSDDALQAMGEAIAAYNASTVTVQVANPQVSVLMGVGAPGGGRTGKPQAASVLRTSDNALGEDVAILRIRGYDNLPTVDLAPSGNLAVGSRVFVSGFPADATYIKDFSAAAQLQPTVSGGTITAQKSNSAGVPVLQTDAKASPGSSGGPAFDDQGRVVGILVSGAVDQRGVSVGQQFLMPLEVLRDDLRTVNAAPATSLTTTVYQQALKDYYRGYYSRALPGFRQVKDLFPAHAYVDKYISDSQTAITQGRDLTPAESDSSMLLFIGGGVLILLLGGGVALVLVLRSRRGRRPSDTTGGAPAAAPAMPPYAPAGPDMPVVAHQPQYVPAGQPAPYVPAQQTAPYAPAQQPAPYAPVGQHVGAPVQLAPQQMAPQHLAPQPFGYAPAMPDGHRPTDVR